MSTQAFGPAKASAREIGPVPVRVVLAMPDRTQEVTLQVAVGTGARAALHVALERGLSLAGTGLEPDRVALGVFGRRVADDAALRAHDRLELYRPLHQDPMARRRREARRISEAGRE